jgi:hypothetical protein
MSEILAISQSTELLPIEDRVIDLSVQGNPEMVDGERFALRVINGLPENKAFAGLLGYELERESEGWKVSVPSPDKLNALRQEKLGGTEANTAEFVFHDGGK